MDAVDGKVMHGDGTVSCAEEKTSLATPGGLRGIYKYCSQRLKPPSPASRRQSRPT